MQSEAFGGSSGNGKPMLLLQLPLTSKPHLLISFFFFVSFFPRGGPSFQNPDPQGSPKLGPPANRTHPHPTLILTSPFGLQGMQGPLYNSVAPGVPGAKSSRAEMLEIVRPPLTPRTNLAPPSRFA